jgi:hypothetical protein
MRRCLLFSVFCLLAPAFAQTTINGGRTVTGPVDNSGATRTAPMKTGTSIPGTCTVGDVFFKTDATAGQNIYECQSTNVFTQQLNSGGGGGTVNSGTTPQMAYYATTGTAVSGATFLGPYYCADAAGSGTTYTAASCTPFTPVAYTTGMTVSFAPGTANTGASTFNINSLGAKSIVADNTTGSALVANDLLTGTGQVYTLIYDGTAFRKISGPDGAWTALPYVASTLTDFSGFGPAGQYRKLNNGDVEVRGLLTCSGNRTINVTTTLWNMPAGYRPTTAYIFFAALNDTNTAFNLEFDTGGATVNRVQWANCVQNTNFLPVNAVYSVY